MNRALPEKRQGNCPKDHCVSSANRRNKEPDRGINRALLEKGNFKIHNAITIDEVTVHPSPPPSSREEKQAAAGCRRGVEERRGVRKNVTYHHQLSSSARAVFVKKRRGRKAVARSCGKQVPDAKRKRDVATRLRYAS
ncbi:hypothetical protein BC835DRAFT_1309247 [Cytidiella melzeri]|nr:hypothetical protein BC835DRAFT_1309247 [Cytidiella melzeri]